MILVSLRTLKTSQKPFQGKALHRQVKPASKVTIAYRLTHIHMDKDRKMRYPACQHVSP